MKAESKRGPVELVHAGFIQKYRVRRLSHHLARSIPHGASVLDVGSGSGELTFALARKRPDLSLHGIDVLIRARSHVPTIPFDGSRLPFSDKSIDAVLLIDVLHHTEDPMILLREARRVAKRFVIVKDHLVGSRFDEPLLRFMDRVGNARYGVALPGNYWTPKQWSAAFENLDQVGPWQTSLGLYPWPFGHIFDRSLHFLTFLQESRKTAPTLRGNQDSERHRGGDICCDPELLPAEAINSAPLHDA